MSGFMNSSILAQAAGGKIAEACARNDFEAAMRIAWQASEQGIGVDMGAIVWGNTPVMLAASYGHSAALEYFLTLGGKHWTTDRNGMTALMWASRNGHMQCVKVLLRMGANVETQDSENRSALKWAKLKGHGDAAKALEAASHRTTSNPSSSSKSASGIAGAATDVEDAGGAKPTSEDFVNFKDQLAKR